MKVRGARDIHLGKGGGCTVRKKAGQPGRRERGKCWEGIKTKNGVAQLKGNKQGKKEMLEHVQKGRLGEGGGLGEQE